MYSVGTPLKNVGLTRRMVAIRSARSRGFGTIAIGLPLTSAMAWTPTLAYTWNSGSGTRMTSLRLVSADRTHASSWSPASTYDECLPRTPFGVPVVPPLISSTAGSSGAIGSRAKTSFRLARSNCERW
jgi:hypothetical protein